MDMSRIPVMILCGGMGTRIRDVSDLVPKPMLRIGQYPILWHIMRIYYAAGFRHFVLCLGYKGDEIRDYFIGYYSRTHDITLDFGLQNNSVKTTVHPDVTETALDWKITLVDTGVHSMTGSRVAQAIRYVDHDRFMLTYGDGLGNVDLKGLAHFHERGDQEVTVTGVRPAARFGKLATDGDKVVNFAEKPQTEGEYISGGFMCLNTDVVGRYLSTKREQVLEVEGLPRIAEDGKMAVFRHDGFWMPMDTPTEYNYLNEQWALGKARWKTW